MKGVILSINPLARIIDITHDLRPQDITGAAFSILVAYPAFPHGTIHVAVVDPGVGSDRLPIVVQAGNQIFVGPDNGLFSYVCEREAAAQVFAIRNDSLFRRPVSSTFHGRDIFAPVAAALSTGLTPAEVGEKLNTWNTLGTLRPRLLGNRTLQGRILHIDHFGNCITNFSREDFPGSQSGVRVSVNGRNIGSLRQYFAEPSPRKAESLFAIWGSAGFLEIAARNRSAAKILRAKAGQAVTAHLRNDR
jgi:S-adenosylmethionine hydrolase